MRKSTLILLILITIAVVIAAYFFLMPQALQNQSKPEIDTVASSTQEKIETRNITLYYYNPKRDTDREGNILCSDKGLEAVQREVTVTETPIQDAIKLLLKGELTADEKREGITTEFPLGGFELKGASLKGGVLKLEFIDKENRTSGGACRVTVLRAQIEKTAMQFEEVKSVEFSPNEILQP
jgi:spore germination protein GerM